MFQRVEVGEEWEEGGGWDGSGYAVVYEYIVIRNIHTAAMAEMGCNRRRSSVEFTRMLLCCGPDGIPVAVLYGLVCRARSWDWSFELDFR